MRSLILHRLVTILGVLLAHLLGHLVSWDGLLEVLAGHVRGFTKRALTTVVGRLEGVLAEWNVADDRVLGNVLCNGLLHVKALSFSEGRADLRGVERCLNLLLFSLIRKHVCSWSKR